MNFYLFQHYACIPYLKQICSIYILYSSQLLLMYFNNKNKVYNTRMKNGVKFSVCGLKLNTKIM